MRAPSLYGHFASKLDMVDAMYGQAWDEYDAHAAIAAGGAGEDCPRGPAGRRPGGVRRLHRRPRPVCPDERSAPFPASRPPPRPTCPRSGPCSGCTPSSTGSVSTDPDAADLWTALLAGLVEPADRQRPRWRPVEPAAAPRRRHVRRRVRPRSKEEGPMSFTETSRSSTAARRPALDRDVAMELAATEYTRLLDLVGDLSPEDWTLPTECPGWDVRAMAGTLRRHGPDGHRAARDAAPGPGRAPAAAYLSRHAHGTAGRGARPPHRPPSSSTGSPRSGRARREGGAARRGSCAG